MQLVVQLLQHHQVVHPLIVNSTNSNNNKVIFQNNGSAVSHLGGLSNGVVFGNAGTQIGRLDGDGLKFGTDTAATNAR